MARHFDVVVISGPTASGKTGLGIALAKELGGEIVSADARQIFRHMDIGTAKPTCAEQAQAKHHLIDIVEPYEQYSAGQFAQDASTVIQKIVDENKVPIVVGGAGLYLKALFEGFAPIPDVPQGIRLALQAKAKADLSQLYDKLKSLDPEWAAKIQHTDRQRIIRGLEVFEATGKTLTHFQNLPRKPLGGHWRTRWFALDWPRDTLYDRINSRSETMVEDGLVQEVKALLGRGYSPDLNALKTFGYKEFFQYLDGILSLEQAIEELQKGTRHYAKRQLTWFRRESQIQWIDAETPSLVDVILGELDA